MTKKIFRSIFLASMVVLLCCLVIILGVLYDDFTDNQQKELKAQVYMMAEGVEYGGVDYVKGIENADCRITLIDSQGTVLFDNETSSEEMENHNDREEIRQARAEGYGESERYSVTLMERQIYSAVETESGYVIRASVTQYTMLAYIMIMMQPILLVIIAAVALSAFLASRLSKRVVKPLNDIDLDEPLKNEGYDELSPLMTRLENQRRQIRRQLDELHRRQNEFDAITGRMTEGLVLISGSGTILSINNAAMSIFNVDKDCVGKDILTAQRSVAVQNLIKEAKKNGHSEALLDLDGREYQLNASAIRTGDGTAGIAMLIFDVTERVKSEQLRREFTANVSHELKTPLHTISGCAELLNNGLVKPENVKEFTQQIYSEAQRLITLVDDIIRLSRLDEGTSEFTKETVSLKAICEDVVKNLEPSAKAVNVTVSVEGDDVVFSSVPQLISGTVYNLCDNAIKYNKDNGSVTVKMGRKGDDAFVTVSDTGIGIAEGHKERIFERFYRVDKSHSKKIGGTGLGLSIVKHSVQLLGGKIELESRENVGTTITVTIPVDKK